MPLNKAAIDGGGDLRAVVDDGVDNTVSGNRPQAGRRFLTAPPRFA